MDITQFYQMQDAIDAVKKENPWETNPYFTNLATMDREDFIETQIQFLFAVVFFSRPMSVLMARLPRPQLRLGLLGNIREEHGSGDLRQSHEETFLSLLSRLGISRHDVEKRALWPEVRAFNTVLTGVCTLDDVPTAVATLGMIEDLFAKISAYIGNSIVQRGWLKKEEVVHYAVHEILDEDHAADLYDVVAPAWKQPGDVGMRSRYQIAQGLELGNYIFLRLYRDLYEARTRRTRRQILGPHSIADGWYIPTSSNQEET